jgi:hypothetical protein
MHEDLDTEQHSKICYSKWRISINFCWQFIIAYQKALG